MHTIGARRVARFWYLQLPVGGNNRGGRHQWWCAITSNDQRKLFNLQIIFFGGCTYIILYVKVVGYVMAQFSEFNRPNVWNTEDRDTEFLFLQLFVFIAIYVNI